jgi:acyl-coenzyme A thioesterase PaaI-like protein
MAERLQEGEARLAADGWSRLVTTVFSASLGTIWMKGEPGSRTIGLLADERVANDHMGSIHGGAQMTFADIAMGLAATDEIGEPRLATVQLQYNFVASAPVGSLLTGEPEVVRMTSQLVFVRGLFKADGRVVGSAEGIMKVFPTARPSAA